MGWEGIPGRAAGRIKSIQGFKRAGLQVAESRVPEMEPTKVLQKVLQRYVQ